MQIVFIGSFGMREAIHRINPNDIVRKSIDMDILCDYDTFEKFVAKFKTDRHVYPTKNAKKMILKTMNLICEAEITWENSTAKELFDLIIADERTEIVKVNDDLTHYYPSLDVLYMLKMSHRYLRNSPAFRKTMDDINLMREYGAKFDNRYIDWYKKREEETYYYKHPSLNKNKNEFFDDTVKYVYDHDTIHEAVKLYDRPAYTYFMKDGAEVACDKNKFFSQSIDIQIASVVEEAMVLALERHQILNDYMPDPTESFLIALEKVCTSITSGWWREFAWENYHRALGVFYWNQSQKNYVDKFKEALYSCRIKPFTRRY